MPRNRSSHGAKRWVVLLGVAAAGVVMGPSAAREFGDHDRPWAQDLTAGSPGAQAQAPAAEAGTAQILAGLAPAPLASSEPGQRVLDLAADKSQRLNAREAALNNRENTLNTAAALIADERAALEALLAHVEAEITRLSAVEDAAMQRRVDLLRQSRPRDAAMLLSDLTPADIAQLMAALSPREGSAIVSELPDAKARAVFDAMAPDAGALAQSAGASGSRR